jgi:hypothetical protein
LGKITDLNKGFAALLLTFESFLVEVTNKKNKGVLRVTS